MPRRPNILVFLIDDLDLERIPFYSRLDAGAAAQKSSQAEGYSCKHGSANCTYAASFLLLLENFLLLLELLDLGELALLVVLPLEPAVGCNDLQRAAGKGAAVPLLLVPAVGDEGERQGAVRDALRVVRNESHVCCAGAR